MTDASTSPQADRPAPAGGFGGGWTLFGVRGVPVRIDRSFLLVVAFVTYLFYGRLTDVLGGEGPVILLLSAVAAAVLFFASILAHELGHALTSLDRDIPVVSITLFALGGVTQSTREARRALDEFVIVGIGPFVSLVLAGGFGLLATATQGWTAVAAVMGYLGWTNLLLAVFNIVPGYPLDGGRLLRALLWGVTGKPNQATRWAARVGQVFALLVIGFGVWALTRGGGFGSIWNLLIGFFLLRGATDAHRRASVRDRLANRTARDVMGSVAQPLAANLTLDEALGIVQQRPSLLWPVGDPLSGGLLLSQIDAVPSAAWPTTTVSQVATSAEELSVAADTPMDQALDRLGEAASNMLFVVEGGRAVGLLTPSLVVDVIS
ncbi:MAG: site-2 protease family protein [Actinomycetota bacterium]|jgi:Zn-dependent protease|nr:site-2 protease family protein [Actinomycetota bacterium]